MPPMSRERKRSMMPPFMSSLTATAVVADAEAGAQQHHAGDDVRDVGPVPVSIAPPKK